MVGTISIKRLSFLLAVDRLKYAGNRISVTALSPASGFNSPALSEFRGIFDELRLTMMLYRSMIQEDALALKEIHAGFETIDQYLANIWNTK